MDELHNEVKEFMKTPGAFLGFFIPGCLMYGIFTYIWVVLGVNVGKSSIH